MAAQGADVDAVHDARVAARRMKAVWDLISPLVDEESVLPMRKATRRVRKRLGELRDLDVMLAHLRAVSRLRGMAAASVWLMERLSQRRAKALKKLKKKDRAAGWIARLDAWKFLRPRVAEMGDAIDRAMQASLTQQVATFCGQADRLVAQMGESLFEHERDPHAVRIAGKQLRYTLEMVAKTGERPSDDTQRLFKRMQDALGLWHDFVVLADHALRETAESGLGHRDPALASCMIRLSDLLLRRSEHYLGRFAKMWRQNRTAVAGLGSN